MNVAKCLILCFLVVSVRAQESFQGFMDVVMEIQEFCEERENVTMEFEFSSEELRGSDNREWKCMLECVASELGIVRRVLKRISSFMFNVALSRTVPQPQVQRPRFLQDDQASLPRPQ
jgi:hypothetical protein